MAHSIAKDRARKDVRRKVSLKRNARKTDQTGQAISHPRHPAVSAISVGKNSGNRKSRDGVAGRETSPPTDRRAGGFKPSVREVAPWRHVGGPKATVFETRCSFSSPV